MTADPYCSNSLPIATLPRRTVLKWALGIALGQIFLRQHPTHAIKTRQDEAFNGVSIVWMNLHTQQTAHIGAEQSIATPIGSVMKLVTTTALLEEGLLQPDQVFDCNRSLRITRDGKPQTLRCQAAHGSQTLVQALGNSCNVYFAQATQRISLSQWQKWATAFGLPISPSTQPVHPLDAFLGLSRIVSVPPQKLLALAASLAQSTGNPPLSQRTHHLLQQGMRLAARNGTGKALDPHDHYQLALKTGTIPHGGHFQSWLVGFFPAASPDYAFVIQDLRGTSMNCAIPSARQWLASGRWKT